MASLRAVPVGAVRVRPAAAADGPGLFGAWQRAREHNASIDRRIVPVPISQPEFVADFEQMLARKTSAAFVAETDGRLVGFISGGVEANQPDRLPQRHATIGYLYVDDGYRRRGIARALFEAVAGWAQQVDGVSHFEMTVITADEAAAAFWRSIGFSPFISRLWAPLSAPERDA